MARITRSDFPGAVHHVFGRGNGKAIIFEDARDYRGFLVRASELKRELGLEILSYCLMPNHYHLCVRTGEIPLSRFMMRLLTYHARVFNDRWNRVGHPFQGRYGARRCLNDNDVRGVIRYIHLNPVAACLSKTPEWAWSSHAAFLGHDDPAVNAQEALGFFDGSPSAYLEFLALPDAKQEREGLASLAQRLGGDAGIVLIRTSANDTATLELRRSFVREAIQAGYRYSDIAKFLGKTRSAISRLICRSLVSKAVNNRG